MFKGTVVGPLGVLREATAGKLTTLEMILEAITADALSRTGIVAAIALLEVLVLLAVHTLPLMGRFSLAITF